MKKELKELEGKLTTEKDSSKQVKQQNSSKDNKIRLLEDKNKKLEEELKAIKDKMNPPAPDAGAFKRKERRENKSVRFNEEADERTGGNEKVLFGTGEY